MSVQVWINGKFHDKLDAKVSVIAKRLVQPTIDSLVRQTCCCSS